MNQRVIETIAEVERFMADRDDALALPREAAAFLHGLVLARGASRVIEIGTSYGYSGLWIASALCAWGGRLITIDREPRKTTTARSFFEAAGLADAVAFVTGDASSLLPDVEGPIDFVLNDADKENAQWYVELLLPKLSRNAVVLTDNTVSHADQLASFVAWARSCGAFFSTHVPIGSGMELSVRLDPSPR